MPWIRISLVVIVVLFLLFKPGPAPIRAIPFVRDRELIAVISCLPDMLMVPTLGAEGVSIARFFRVLGDPTRIRILELLGEGERSVGELVAAVGQPQPRVSTHLACLRHCGFVMSERRGKEVFYRLALNGLDQVLERAAEAIAPISERLATCTRIGPEWV